MAVTWHPLWAQEPDPGLLSRVAQSIGDNALLADPAEGDTVVPQVVMTSSVARYAPGASLSYAAVHGLAWLDYYASQNLEVEQWELQRQGEIAALYLPSSQQDYEPWGQVAADFGATVTNEAELAVYEDYGRTMSDVQNLYRTQLGLGPSDEALRANARGAGILTGSLQTAQVIVGSLDAVFSVFDATTEAWQAANPPIYLNTRTGPHTWMGEGRIVTSSGQTDYRQELDFSTPGEVTRTHTEWMLPRDGQPFRVEVQTITPLDGTPGRAAAYRPLGSYYDINTSSRQVATPLADYSAWTYTGVLDGVSVSNYPFNPTADGPWSPYVDLIPQQSVQLPLQATLPPAQSTMLTGVLAGMRAGSVDPGAWGYWQAPAMATPPEFGSGN